ncbi:DUF4179 domain-containing protein [Clostridium sp. B9]|uniref:DUF4179 domain-containing protein n=1 Tax=Clostridium sp. B9 TaxID=3423224 RepID=UPI003D2F04A0
MSKKINKEDKLYEILNDVEINLDEYSMEEFNELENKRIKKTLRGKLKMKNGLKKKSIIAASTVAVLGFTLLNTNVGVYALDSIGTMAYNISDALGIGRNLDDYKTVVNQVKVKNGISVKLDEVILNNDELIVSYIAKSDVKLVKEYGHISLFGHIWINGKSINSGAGGSSEKIDDHTVKGVTTYDLGDVKLSGDTDVKIKFYDAMLSGFENEKLDKDGNTTPKEIKGPWTFEFKTNGDELAIETEEFKLDDSFILPNGNKITLNRMTRNKIGCKIYYSEEDLSKEEKGKTYDMLLKGTDNNGKKVEFYLSQSSNEGGVFVEDNLERNITKDTKSITLTSYAVAFPEESGKMSNDYKQIGEPFTINLEK